MTEYQQKVSDSWGQRMRLIRLRRKKENLRFWQEFKIIPRWLVWVVVIVFLKAQLIALLVNHYRVGVETFPPELQNHPMLQSLALAGMITVAALFLGTFILLVGYVNQDAKRRGMNSTLWTFLVLVLSPAYFAVGFIVYFLLREPLPYTCPHCAATVGPRYNFCPSCKYNLHPACPQCKTEVGDTDKFCPYCAQELTTAGTNSATAIERSS